MLVLSREQDESVIIGTNRLVMAELTDAEEAMLRRLAQVSNPDRPLSLLASRLLSTMTHPIEVKVLDVRGDKVRLGVTAPTSIPVNRYEVLEAIERERNRKAI